MIRNKITIIIITITFAFVFLSNIAFEKFFANYLENQEEAQINSINRTLESFFNEKMDKYQGSVNDWAHWNETYDFMNNNTPDYIDNNLIGDTFVNLDVNFIILAGNDNSIKSKQFYDITNEQFAQFPVNLDKDIEGIIRTYKIKEDTSSILKLGDQFYFVATSKITDSYKEKQADGRMIIGRLIDQGIIKKLEAMTDSHISISIINNFSDDVPKELYQEEDNSVPFQPVKLTKGKDNMQLEFIIANIAHEESSVFITLTKTRDLFIGGMNQIKNFLLIYTFSMILILIIVFILLGLYISRPFSKLINEVKSLDLTYKRIQKLEVYGKDEFTFLRNSVNNMLNRIEIEQGKVKENEEKLFATLASVGDGVIAVDENGLVDFMNLIAQNLTGWCQEEAYGQSFETVFEIINEYTRERVESPIQKVFEVEQTIELANHTLLISKDGLEKAIEDTAAPIKDRFGKVIGVVIVFRDFSDKKEKRKQIEYLSYHDQLTSLYNRRFFEEELKRLDTKRNLPLSIVFADVNGLKTINDAFGHQYGDLLIQQVSDVFKRECRADDIIARTGGDEFIILLPKTEAGFAEKLVCRLKERIEQEKIMEINISVSFGLDTKNTENQSTSNVLKNAEDLMYQKKIFDSFSKRNVVIKSILNSLYLKSPWENAHSKRVSVTCEAIGKAYQLGDDEIKELRVAGELHDIGKIAVDEVILNKTGILSEAEWAKIKQHPETGYRLLGTSSEYYNIAEYVLAHHERWDGTGYPKGLKGEAIHWKARIIALADAYDAMIFERPYRRAFSEEETVAEIKRNVGTQFDPDIARVFVKKVLGLKW